MAPQRTHHGTPSKPLQSKEKRPLRRKSPKVPSDRQNGSSEAPKRLLRPPDLAPRSGWLAPRSDPRSSPDEPCRALENGSSEVPKSALGGAQKCSSEVPKSALRSPRIALRNDPCLAPRFGRPEFIRPLIRATKLANDRPTRGPFWRKRRKNPHETIDFGAYFAQPGIPFCAYFCLFRGGFT